MENRMIESKREQMSESFKEQLNITARYLGVTLTTGDLDWECDWAVLNELRFYTRVLLGDIDIVLESRSDTVMIELDGIVS